MYLRIIQRHNTDGSTIRYVQIAHNTRNPRTGASTARTIYSLGREDTLDRAALRRLAESILRYLDRTEPLEPSGQPSTCHELPAPRAESTQPTGSSHHNTLQYS
ncbi:hypothetical protein [Leekyejoonella antrihumi]|uniref:Uncharacterized protein n=1 Tax=Leekyejoonella antrihumi TaxID=1660198 RepID=A0A563DPE2_9MICO|nr:hypothetical protein [Leekyejoonella antrihumi]TWP32077.1 hypothetical protein FGL98_24720 [Leekyejoonella antrihumi]